MLEYLDKCATGCRLIDDTLQDEIHKLESGKWAFADDERVMTATEIIAEMRFVVREDGGDPDACLVEIQPADEIDRIRMKKEIMENEEEVADSIPAVRSSAPIFFDLTQDDEGLAFVDGGSVPEAVRTKFAAYVLPLHIRLPPGACAYGNA